MPLRIRDNLHWCDCGGRAVFLDAANDRYFCLPSAVNAAFLRLAGGEPESAEIGDVHSLVARGLLVENPGHRGGLQPPPVIKEPTSDFQSGQIDRANVLHVVRAIGSEFRAARSLASRPLLQILEEARSNGRDSRRPRDPEGTVRAIVAASASASYLLRSHDRCLVRALALHALCRANGIRPKLVFGVIAHPFSAHCWVQLASSVLVGAYEQARLYTPILVVE